jgi:hypothetical protein
VTDTPRMTVQQSGDALLVAGAIDEHADLMGLLKAAQGGKLALDLFGVTFINSLGVRDWIRMQAAATSQGIRIELRRVAEVLIHQLNMIIATRGTARVTSFVAPYACDKCGREESHVIDAVAHAHTLAALQPPPMTCPECGAQMEFNDFPERYFSFLTPT